MTSLQARLEGSSLIVLLAILATVLVAAVLVEPLSTLLAQQGTGSGAYDPARMVLLHSDLPRLSMAILCGGALAASGAILQQALRNPLASPTTLGIDAGARLALALATLFAPALFGFGRDAVALLGSAVSTALVFVLVRRNFSAVSVVLAGLVVSLYCGALAAILVLVKDRYLVSLFIWGAGSLAQQSWQPTIDLAWRLAILAVPVALLARPLSLLDLDEAGARSLGLKVGHLRFAAVALAVCLAAFVASAVGVIGFVGLIAPVLARLAGARRFAHRLVLSSAIGALLLLATECAVTLLSGVSSQFLPTGAVTAVIGAPLLFLLLPKLRSLVRPTIEEPAPSPFMIDGRVLVMLVAAAFALVLWLALALGRDVEGGWMLLSIAQGSELLDWRAPRLLAASIAGAMAAVSGFILQRLTGNDMASPEVLGVSAGATFAFAMSLFVVSDLGFLGQSLVTTVGSLLVLLVILAYGRRTGFSPETVLLAGITLNALLDAVTGVLAASGDPRAFLLVDWIGGSTQGITLANILPAACLATIFLGLSLTTARWLSILPLGAPQASALGVSMPVARFCLLALAAILAAAATPIIGPLTFVGLMAPHIVRYLGARTALPALVGSAMIGAALMAIADLLARTAAFPYQLPTGLVAALVGAPALLYLLGRRTKTP